MNTWKLQELKPGEGMKTGTHTETYDDSEWLPIDAPDQLLCE